MPNPTIMKSPREIDVEITPRCNLRCRYCYYFDNDDVDYTELPTAEWLQFFAECGQAAVMKLTLCGGEPFARKDLPQLIEGIVANRMRFAILSNGTLIDDDMAAFLKNTGRCDYVQVSIDGSCAEVHDSCRGKGNFDKAVRGLRILQQHGVDVAVRLTIHHFNVDDLPAAARFLLEDLGLDGFSTNAAGYLGSCKLNAADIQLTTEDRQKAMELLAELNETCDGRISAAAGPLAEARMWTEMEAARQAGTESLPLGGALTGCGCTFSKLAVRADGMYVPCNMLPHMVLGRINEASLIDVWQQHPELRKLRERSTIPLDSIDFCRGCDYISYCTGNCPGLAYTLVGDVNLPSPDACLRRFLAAGGRLPHNSRDRETTEAETDDQDADND